MSIYLVKKTHKNNILSLYLVIRKGAINSFNKTREKIRKKRTITKYF